MTYGNSPSNVAGLASFDGRPRLIFGRRGLFQRKNSNVTSANRGTSTTPLMAR
jgi:hypothetical protein